MSPKYTTEFHRNSNRTRHIREDINRELAARNKPLRDFDEHPIMSAQIWRGGSDEPEELPRGYSRQVLRAHRSKYDPHVGAKQKAKAGLIPITR